MISLKEYIRRIEHLFNRKLSFKEKQSFAIDWYQLAKKGE